MPTNKLWHRRRILEETRLDREFSRPGKIFKSVEGSLDNVLHFESSRLFSFLTAIKGDLTFCNKKFKFRGCGVQPVSIATSPISDG